MRLIRMLGVALVWVMGVVLVASLSWVAINSAGREVVDTAVIVADPRTAVSGSTVDEVVPTPSTVTSLAPPSFITGSGPSTSAGQKTGGTSGSTATAERSGSSHAPTRPALSASSAPTQTVPTVVPAADTMATSGGVVWLECTGPVISDLLVQPNTGWSAGNAMRGSGELDVRFGRKDTNIEVTGTCPSGQPHFDVRTSEHKDDGDDHDD